MANALTRATAGEKQAKTNTPQTVEVPGKNQVKNNAGGFVFEVSDKDRIERFLILGTEKGTYYAGEDKLTKDNIDFLRRMVKKNERLVVDLAVDVSVNGRAYKNAPAIFAIALVLSEGKDKDYAVEAAQKINRISTHVFEFAQHLDNLGGWGRAKKRAVAKWYESKTADELAYQAVKYRQRNGWTHRDLMRLSHPKGVPGDVGAFILGKADNSAASDVNARAIIRGFKFAKEAQTLSELLNLALTDYPQLPWEALPTQFLKAPEVWKKLFYNGQLRGQALVRNITRLARIGAFDDMVFAADYAAKLTDIEMIRKTRLHPINFLNAAVVHEFGQIDRQEGWGWIKSRKKNWNTSSVILDALNDGFHSAFKTIEPANKRTLVAMDVSGSMGQDALGLDLSCAQVAAAVGMTIARTEPYYKLLGFSNYLKDLGITPKMGLATAMRKVSDHNFGRTDCSVPMKYASDNGIEVDTFIVITDNETYAGKPHPFQALKQYRDKTGIDARLAVLGVSSTGFTIADPSDKGMMDFAGFDSSAPSVLADFSAGRI